MQSEQPVVPGTGRILDYWYGGAHHTAADVGAAQAFESVYPNIGNVFRTLRAYQTWMVRYIYGQGINQFLVFGAGIPTQLHVHEVLPQARVVYTDIDPLCVTYGEEILETVPNTAYTFCDITDLAGLDRTITAPLIDFDKPLGLVSVGVSAFLTDEPLKAALAALYHTVADGSYFAIDFD
ncbi:MAG: hypothetical protein HC893_01585, partial [Chloroflexaceae bacterium]|nr:hypothetical protein [Chloroflexaceae bacterium]